MIVRTPSVADADGHVAEMYQDDLASDGVVYQHTRAMAVNPAAHAAFVDLIRAVVPSIGVDVYELATLGAARAIGSPHCLLAHTRKAIDAGTFDADTAMRFAARDEALDERSQAVISYAERLSHDPSGMTDADTQALRDVGFDDRQIVDITLAAAARNLLSRTLLALAVPVDHQVGLDDQLQASLRALCAHVD